MAQIRLSRALSAEYHDLFRTLEIDPEDLASASRLSFTANTDDIRDCNVYIVTVPTPITRHRQPDLTPLRSAMPVRPVAP